MVSLDSINWFTLHAGEETRLVVASKRFQLLFKGERKLGLVVGVAFDVDSDFDFEKACTAVLRVAAESLLQIRLLEKLACFFVGFLNLLFAVDRILRK
jgi:hypothetical protein